MHTAINGRLDAISSISSAMQRLSAVLAETAKPYWISCSKLKSWEGSHDRPVQELHGRCICGRKHGQTKKKRIVVRVDGVDKVEGSILAVDCTETNFRTFETALYQISHRTKTNELGA